MREKEEEPSPEYGFWRTSCYLYLEALREEREDIAAVFGGALDELRLIFEKDGIVFEVICGGVEGPSGSKGN